MAKFVHGSPKLQELVFAKYMWDCLEAMANLNLTPYRISRPDSKSISISSALAITYSLLHPAARLKVRIFSVHVISVYC